MTRVIGVNVKNGAIQADPFTVLAHVGDTIVWKLGHTSDIPNDPIKIDLSKPGWGYNEVDFVLLSGGVAITLNTPGQRSYTIRSGSMSHDPEIIVEKVPEGQAASA